jgi:hypothetical protein
LQSDRPGLRRITVPKLCDKNNEMITTRRSRIAELQVRGQKM